MRAGLDTTFVAVEFATTAVEFPEDSSKPEDSRDVHWTLCVEFLSTVSAKWNLAPPCLKEAPLMKYTGKKSANTR